MAFEEELGANRYGRKTKATQVLKENMWTAQVFGQMLLVSIP